MSLIRRLCFVLGVLLQLWPHAGLAAMETDSVVVLYTIDDEMVVQLSAELRALGYIPVLFKRPSTALTIGEAQKIVESSGSVALTNVRSEENQVEVWAVDPLTYEISLVETVGKGDDLQTKASVILRSVELLRATLMKIESRREEKKKMPPKPAPKPAPPKPPAESQKQRSRSVDLALGPSVTYGFSDLPPILQLWLATTIRGSGRLGLDLSAALPTFSQKMKTEYGKAGVWHIDLAAGLRFDLMPRQSRWIPWLGLIGGVHIIYLRGKDARQPYVDKHAWMLVSLIALRAGLNVRLVGRWSLLLAMHTGLVLPRPIVVVGEVKVPWGYAILGGMVGLKAEIF